MTAQRLLSASEWEGAQRYSVGQEGEEFLGSPGVVEEIHGEHQIHRPSRLTRAARIAARLACVAGFPELAMGVADLSRAPAGALYYELVTTGP